MTPGPENISLADATALLCRPFGTAGVPAACAQSVAAALVAAEARLSDYAAQVRSGKIDATAEPSCREFGPASLVVDAAHGFAYPALALAISSGIAAAHSTGCAAVSVTCSHHCGALSVQLERIARQGMIGLMVVNAPVAIAPWGSHRPLFGPNPIAFAAPRTDGPHLVIDLSLWRVARGKVMDARKSGRPIPEGWARDREGNPTTDAEAALAGSMIAIGEAKGTAPAMIVETLAAALTGARFSAEMSSYFTADGPPPGSGQLLLILRPGDGNAFAARLESILGQIAALDGARLPGSRRAAALAQAQTKGLDAPQAYLQEARSLVGDHG